ncbi:MAG: putative membrane protein [Candidatus Methanocomedens sp.]|nr:MAG: putative membrane protein [ANME-2 cluster archaeon]
MLFEILIFIIALLILVYSSDIFTKNASRLAKSFGVSHFFIGITIVGIGTSLPEIMITDYASYTGDSGIVLGNVIGSNITNIAFVLGTAFFIRNTVISGSHMFRDSLVHILILAFGITTILTGDRITRVEGVVLCAVYILYILYTLKSHTKPKEENDKARFDVKAMLYTMLSLGGVLLGSKLLVDSAVVMAGELGISSAVIGLTIIALGTSLPELMVSISAAKRGFTMLILGNIVGSNVTNVVLAMGTASIINEVVVDEPNLFRFNIAYMMLLSLILVVIVRKKEISRLWGILYLAMYVFFIGYTYVI